MNVLVTCIVFTILLCGFKLYKEYVKQKKLRKCLDVFPGDKCYPVIGSCWRFLGLKREHSFELIKSIFKEFGPTWILWFGNKPLLFISKVEHLEVMFKDTVNINKGESYRLVEPWLGQGLITTGGDLWKTNRRLLSPAFHFKILDKYSDVFYAKSCELIDILENQKDYVDVFPYITRWGLDIIAETGMGVKFDCLKNPNSKYALAIFKMCELFSVRARHPWYHNDFIFNLSSPGRTFRKHLKIIKDTNMRIISARRSEYQKQKHNKSFEDDIGIKEKLALLDILLQNQDENNFTDKEICDEVSTFMFAGQDTTASTVAFALLEIANYPDIQTNIQQELDKIFKGKERPITPEDLADMDYLERVIKETLRSCSVVPIVARKLQKEIFIDGKVVPPGVNIQLCLYQMHHDPNVWPNPDKFDPDRFLPENSRDRHVYAFSPFSAGLRNCIGRKFGTRNAKTALASILRKFNITCLERPETFSFVSEIVLRPLVGPHIKFEKRSSFYYNQ